MNIEIVDSVVHDENDRIDRMAKMFRIDDSGGFMIGCYSKKNDKVYVWAVVSKRKGFLKEAMSEVCSRFNCYNVEFTNVITDGLLNELRWFRPVLRRFKDMDIICLVGRWERDRDE